MRAALASTLLCLVWAVPVQADVFHLANGGQVVGDLVNVDESPRKTFRIRTGQGIVVSLERAAVSRHETTRPAQEEYEQIKPTFPDTVEGQMKLADWCAEHSLYDAQKIHLERVIELEPDHRQARASLGYIPTDNGWQTREELMSNRGMVRRGNRFYLPQQIELMEQREKQERAEREWFRKIRMWRGWLDDPRRLAEGKARIEAIDDPVAVPALKHYLDEEQHATVRLLYLVPLRKLGTMPANELLVHRILTDPHREVRLQALDYAIDNPQPEITMSLIRSLRSKQNDVINRAAHALAHLKAEAAVGPLIDALVTKHKYRVTIGSPGGMSTTFGGSSAGGSIGGFSAGSTTKEITEHVPNTYVLEALVQLTGQNFGYNTPAWKQWFNQQNTPESLNPRRD